MLETIKKDSSVHIPFILIVKRLIYENTYVISISLEKRE